MSLKNSIYIILLLHTTSFSLQKEHLRYIFPTRWTHYIKEMYTQMNKIFCEIKEYIASLPTSLYETYKPHHTYASQPAYVRYTESDDLCQEELTFIQHRSKKICNALETLYHAELDPHRLPKIGLVFSGGGFRSLFSTCGFISGLEHTGLLDTILYCSTLSGSTWAVAPWIVSKKSIDDYSTIMIKHLSSGLHHINDSVDLKQLFSNILNKLLTGQYLSVIDIYGAILANTLLKPFCTLPICAPFSKTHEHVIEGSYPLPIYTAIISNQSPYEWLECTPFEIGSSFLTSYIPSWAVGRSFCKGISTDFGPEQTLGYFLGIFGSAFEINLKDAVKLSTENLIQVKNQLPDLLAKALKKCLYLVLNSFLGQVRLFPALLHNYTYQHEHISWTQEELELIDAGIDFNIPLPPLLRPTRQLDILIIYDASASITEARELRKAQEYAQQKGYLLPPIDFSRIDKELISIFKANDTKTPILIYFPRIKNEEFSPHFDPDHSINYDYCHSFNFYYTQEQAKTVYGFAQFVAEKSKSIIINVIRQVLQERYNYPLQLTQRNLKTEEILSMRTLEEQFQAHL